MIHFCFFTTLIMSLTGTVLIHFFFSFESPTILFWVFFLSSFYALILYILFAQHQFISIVLLTIFSVFLGVIVTHIFLLKSVDGFIASLLSSCVIGMWKILSHHKPYQKDRFLALWRWRDKMMHPEPFIHIRVRLITTLSQNYIHKIEKEIIMFAAHHNGYLTKLKSRLYVVSYPSDENEGNVYMYWVKRFSNISENIKVSKNAKVFFNRRGFSKLIHSSKKL